MNRIKLKIKSTLLLLLLTNFTHLMMAQESDSKYYQCVGGVYYTYDDFSKGNITDFGVLMTDINNGNDTYKIKTIDFDKPDSILGTKIYSFKVKENKIWGFRRTDGETYRINKKNHEMYNLIVAGPLYLWGYYTNIARDEKGNIKFVGVNVHWGFSKHFYISVGADGELIRCNAENLDTFFKDDPEILAEVKEKPIKENNVRAFQTSINNLIKWVSLHNTKHQ